MTDPVETRAPERVYLDGDATIDEGYWPRCFGTPKPCSEPALEYIRADVVTALVAEAVKAEREACNRISLDYAKKDMLAEWKPYRIAAAIRERGEG